MRRTVPLLTAALLLLTACTAVAVEHEVPAPAQDAPDGETVGEEPAGEVEVPDGLRLTGVVEQDSPDSTPYGRVTLVDDHPVLTIDPAKIPSEVTDAGYTVADVEGVLAVAARYAIEEGLDSILLETDRREEWLAANQHWWEPSNLENVTLALEDLEEGRWLGGLVDPWLAADRANHRLVYAEGGSRISAMDLREPEVLLAPNGDLAVQLGGWVERPAELTSDVTDDDGTVYEAGTAGVELTCFEQAYAAVPHEGQWVFTGWNTAFHHGRDSDLCLKYRGGDPAEIGDVPLS